MLIIHKIIKILTCNKGNKCNVSGILRQLNVKCFCFEEIILCIEAFTSIEPKNPPNIIILQPRNLKISNA